MYCHNCGHKNPAGANFCSTCGATLQPQDATDTTITFTPEKEAEAKEEFSVPFGEIEEGKALLIVRKGPDAGARFTLDKDVITCGRDPGSDIFLDDVTVSRKHARILRVDNHFEVEDVGSLNGTFVNRERVESMALKNADEIQIGKFKLVIFTEAPTG